MNQPVLGRFVTSKHYPYKGRVTTVYVNFDETPEDQAWLDAQSIPPTENDLGNPWYSVLVEPEGSALVPSSALQIVDPFPLTNPNGARYFADLSPDQQGKQVHHERAQANLERPTSCRPPCRG